MCSGSLLLIACCPLSSGADLPPAPQVVYDLATITDADARALDGKRIHCHYRCLKDQSEVVEDGTQLILYGAVRKGRVVVLPIPSYSPSWHEGTVTARLRVEWDKGLCVFHLLRESPTAGR
jgi:hypothetical protein